MSKDFTEYKKLINKYIRNSILKPYLIHVEFEIENIHSKIKTDICLRELMELKGYCVKSFELDMKSAIQKIRELQEIFREFDI